MFKTKSSDEAVYAGDLSEDPLVVFLNSRDFKNLNTRLADLFPGAGGGAVASALREIYGMDEENVQAHLEVFERLKMEARPPEPGDDEAILVVTADDGPESRADYGAHAFKPGDLDELYFYSLTLTPWGQWLKYPVVEENVAEIGLACFVAVCLYEMTFCGFEEEEIANTGSLVRERLEEIKSCPECRGTSFEEVFGVPVMLDGLSARTHALRGLRRGLKGQSPGAPGEDIKHYLQAAEEGRAEARFRLALAYDFGEGVKADEGQAFKWYRRAAKQGLAEAMFALGVSYHFGVGVEINEAEAARWYRRAGRRGLAEAMFRLGNIYRLGEDGKDTEAARWYGRAARKGHLEAMRRMALAYDYGLGVGKDAARALKWHFRAARRGHPESQFRLGRAYDAGEGLEKNPAEAARWYLWAARKGHVEAKYRRGLACDGGLGLKADKAQAVRWYGRAARSWHRESRFLLGLAYDSGEGVPKNPAEAIRLFRLAAADGHPEAMFRLGQAYRLGRGVEIDQAKAAGWYRRAANKGHAEAKAFEEI